RFVSVAWHRDMAVAAAAMSRCQATDTNLRRQWNKSAPTHAHARNRAYRHFDAPQTANRRASRLLPRSLTWQQQANRFRRRPQARLPLQPRGDRASVAVANPRLGAHEES